MEIAVKNNSPIPEIPELPSPELPMESTIDAVFLGSAGVFYEIELSELCLERPAAS